MVGDRTNRSMSKLPVELQNADVKQSLLDEEDQFMFEEDFVIDEEWFDHAYAVYEASQSSNPIEQHVYPQNRWGVDRENAPVYRWRGCNWSILTAVNGTGGYCVFPGVDMAFQTGMSPKWSFMGWMEIELMVPEDVHAIIHPKIEDITDTTQNKDAKTDTEKEKRHTSQHHANSWMTIDRKDIGGVHFAASHVEEVRAMCFF